jgi:Cu+-exporting ATPase
MTHQHPHVVTGSTVRDPVCGMTVDPAAGKPSHRHGGRDIHFCNPKCKDKFVATPGDYETARDPVCGMTVDRASADHMARREGQRFYFCGAGCQKKFEADPASYTGETPKAALAVPEGTKWTCPMHPEIVSDTPADCPICGMALEPMGIPTGDEGPNPELVDFKRRMWVGAALTLPRLCPRNLR